MVAPANGSDWPIHQLEAEHRAAKPAKPAKSHLLRLLRVLAAPLYDYICWQLHRDVPEVCDLLAGFEEVS